MEILVTGGAGFIGSNLVDRLLRDGHSVTVLDNFCKTYDPAVKRRNIEHHQTSGDFRLVEGDIRDVGLLHAIMRATAFDRVVHLAAMAGVQPSFRYPSLYREVNETGTQNILETCVKFGKPRLVLASSSSVYGKSQRVRFDESQALGIPLSPYAATKKAAELLALGYFCRHQIQTTCLRFFTVFGPRQRPDMAIHMIMNNILHGREVCIHGDGRSSRDYTFVSDIVDGIVAALSVDIEFEIINLGTSVPTTLLELISNVEHTVGMHAKVAHRSARRGDMSYACASIVKATQLLCYEPRVSLIDGLKEFALWLVRRTEMR